MSDLIRREDVDKAIQNICDLCGEDKKNNGVMCGACNLDSFIREYEDVPSAEPERIIKIGQRSGKTLESAIDYLHSVGWLQEHDRILTESAEPERKWIPVTEALPINDVIVSVLDNSGDTPYRFTSVGWCTPDGQYWVVDNEMCNGVIAWMPLPEPWRGD